jgi:hypothetical protein
MKHFQSLGARKMLVILTVLILFVSTPTASLANTRVLSGGQVPFYAQLSMDETVTDGTWVGIVFFRPPSCIPAEFNLLLYFDFTAFDCQPATMDGFDIWGDIETDPAPLYQVLKGLGAVPVWFVSLTEYQAAKSDGILTIGELEGMDSLRTGVGSKVNVVFHTAISNSHHAVITASGALDGGGTFVLNAFFRKSTTDFEAVIHLRD